MEISLKSSYNREVQLDEDKRYQRKIGLRYQYFYFYCLLETFLEKYIILLISDYDII